MDKTLLLLFWETKEIKGSATDLEKLIILRVGGG